MKLLLDTHTLLWWDGVPTRLSTKALKLLQDPSSRLYISIATLWELQIKVQLGKLQLRVPLNQIVQEQQRDNRVQMLLVKPAHIYALDGLPLHHRDPFDRMLIAQAQTEKAVLVSQDAVFSQYPVSVIW
ncbi:MAG: type II toxin-antitoxin system VapC family toxin [Anaerolineae bacterium]